MASISGYFTMDGTDDGIFKRSVAFGDRASVRATDPALCEET